MSLLTQQVRANATTLVSDVGSGGGGGGGPDITVSTITFPSSGGQVLGSGGEILWYAGFRQDSAQGGFIIDGGSSQVSMSANTSTAQIAFGFNQGGTVSNNAYIRADAQSQNLIISAPTPNYNVVLENVSTINGSVPGGGGAAVSTFNSLQVSNSIAGGAALNMYADDLNLYKIDMVSSATSRAAVSLGTIGGRDQVYLQPAAQVAGDLRASTITLAGFPVPLFENGRFTMPNAASNVIETDIVFSGTTWGAWAGYDGAVQASVSSIATEVLSRSTFAIYAQGGLGVSWQVLGN